MFCGILLNAQSDSELLFFNSSGHIVLVREDVVIKKIQGERFLRNDILKIIGGNVTIINLNNKRVTMDEPGNYIYDDVAVRMQLAETSLSNRYFIYVWKKMNKEDKQVNQPGGVIRGDDFATAPPDSIIVLSDTINFCANNESDGDFNLIIKSDDNKIIGQYPIRNELSLSVLDINDGKPGRYYWEIKIPFGKSPEKKYFVIPDEEIRNTLVDEYKKNISEFSSFENEIKLLLIDEYIKDKKTYFHTDR